MILIDLNLYFGMTLGLLRICCNAAQLQSRGASAARRNKACNQYNNIQMNGLGYCSKLFTFTDRYLEVVRCYHLLHLRMPEGARGLARHAWNCVPVVIISR